jgi:2-polyprenyl-3-methyl-5-hydroxy-6-metoxy-1,4-benzoquinol methylase
MNKELNIKNQWTRMHFGSFISRDEWIVKHCVDKKVLHIGCADVPFTLEKYKDGSALQLRIAKFAKIVIGIDLEEEVIDYCQSNYGSENCQYITVEKFNAFLEKYQFDLIVCGDVIEHVGDVEGFIKMLSRYAKKYQADLILTTINATSLKGFCRALQDRESVHPDHNYYFSASTLGTVFSKYLHQCSQEIVYFNYDSKFRILFDVISKFKPLLSDGIGFYLGKLVEK